MGEVLRVEDDPHLSPLAGVNREDLSNLLKVSVTGDPFGGLGPDIRGGTAARGDDALDQEVVVPGVAELEVMLRKVSGIESAEVMRRRENLQPGGSRASGENCKDKGLEGFREAVHRASNSPIYQYIGRFGKVFMTARERLVAKVLLGIVLVCVLASLLTALGVGLRS